MTEEQDREVEVECAYIPQSDKEICHTDSVFQTEPGEDVDSYLENVAVEMKKFFLVEGDSKFCEIEKITGGYKIFFCNEKGEKLEVITVMDRGIDSDEIRYLDAVKYKYLDF